MWLQKSKWLSLRILSTTVYCFNEYKGVLGTTKSRYIMIPPHLPVFFLVFFFTRFLIIFFSIYVIFLSSVQLLDFEDIVLMYVSLWVTLNENHFIIKAALIKFYKIILFCLYLKNLLSTGSTVYWSTRIYKHNVCILSKCDWNITPPTPLFVWIPVYKTNCNFN